MKQFIVRRETVASQVVHANNEQEAQAIAIDKNDAWEHQDTCFDAEESK